MSTRSVFYYTPYDGYYEEVGRIERSKLATRRDVIGYVEHYSNNNTILVKLLLSLLCMVYGSRLPR